MWNRNTVYSNVFYICYIPHENLGKDIILPDNTIIIKNRIEQIIYIIKLKN